MEMSGLHVSGDPNTHLTGKWVNLRASLDTMDKRKTSCLYWKF